MHNVTYIWRLEERFGCDIFYITIFCFFIFMCESGREGVLLYIQIFQINQENLTFSFKFRHWYIKHLNQICVYVSAFTTFTVEHVHSFLFCIENWKKIKIILSYTIFYFLYNCMACIIKVRIGLEMHRSIES